MDSWIWIILVSSIAFLLMIRKLLNPKAKKNLPPGPRGLPIFGHLHLLGKNPHRDLHQLAKKHGPIMYMNFGHVPTVVASSPAAAELFLKTHDLAFCDRPYHLAADYLSYGQKGLVFARYGAYWRDMRKLCTLELLSNLKISQFQPIRKAEIELLVESIKGAAERGEMVDLSKKITGFNADVTCLMVCGEKFADEDVDKKGFKAVVKETMVESAAFNFGDYFPFLHKLDLQRSVLRLRNLSKIFDGFLEKMLDDHARDKNEKKQRMDFVGTLLDIMESGEAGFVFDRNHVKAVVLDMLLAGTDTSGATVDWALAEVIRHPRVMQRLQKELELVVGMNQMVNESHLERLEYLNWVVKETLRIRPVGILMMHNSMKDCEVKGFDIPKNARIIINAWSIGRDPSAWTEPDKFMPERFSGSNVDVRGHDFQLLPFGAGRRSCPGIQLGLTLVKLLLAQLVHCFDWELPNGMSPEDLDMSEAFGIVTTRAQHLVATPTYRLQN